MFDCEAAFLQHGKKHGKRRAVEYIADINRYTILHLPYEEEGTGLVKPSLLWARSLFDRNEHFIELSNMGEEDRSLEFFDGIILGASSVLANCCFVFYRVKLKRLAD